MQTRDSVAHYLSYDIIPPVVRATSLNYGPRHAKAQSPPAFDPDL